MLVLAAKWGNSLGVRIPRDLARQAGVAEGVTLDVSIEDGRIVIVPVRRPVEDDPFVTFAEWDGAADRKAYGGL